MRTKQLNCACCKVNCPANLYPISRQLNVKVEACFSSATVSDILPGKAIYNPANANWTWAATVPGNRYPVPGGGASVGDGINTIDQVDLICPDGGWDHNSSDIAVYGSTGVYVLSPMTSAFSVLDPGPGTFRIRFSVLMSVLGLTYCSGDFLRLEFYE